MKKIIAFALLLAMLVSMFGCAETMTSAENFLLAVKSMDFASMKAFLLPDEKAGSLYTRLDTYETTLDASDKEALRSMYALLQYSIGEITENGKTEKTVSVTIKAPNVSKIISLIEPKLLVSGDSAAEVLSGMVTDGTVTAQYMTEKTVSVKMTKTEEGYMIPYEENEAFAEILCLSEAFRFFASN